MEGLFFALFTSATTLPLLHNFVSFLVLFILATRLHEIFGGIWDDFDTTTHHHRGQEFLFLFFMESGVETTPRISQGQDHHRFGGFLVLDSKGWHFRHKEGLGLGFNTTEDNA